ncbi:hypothetical protein CXF95_19650 [Paraglaciecola sp. MB-3u-78]|nr:hypothetical protein CXF95_19650 [Paraglaciecola sp. MB-3u-78]
MKLSLCDAKSLKFTICIFPPIKKHKKIVMNVEENSELVPTKLTGQNIYLRTARMSDFVAIKVYRQDPEKF